MGRSHIGGHGPAILVVTTVFMVLDLGMCALRAIYARKNGSRWRMDFIWIALANLCGTLGFAFQILSVYEGLGNSVFRIGYKQGVEAARWSYPTVYLGALNMCLAKFSVIALLLDVQRGTQGMRRSWPLHLMGACFGVATILLIVSSVVSCTPYSKNYDILGPGTCNLRQFEFYASYVQAAIAAATDIMLALWPMSMIYSLKISRRTRIALCLLMAVGIIPGIASIYRIKLLVRLLHSIDVIEVEGEFLLWATVETGGISFLAGLPPLRMVFLRWASKIPGLQPYIKVKSVVSRLPGMSSRNGATTTDVTLRDGISQVKSFKVEQDTVSDEVEGLTHYRSFV